MSKILVIDDDADMRELLRRHLAKAGYEVSVAGDAEDAGRSLAAATPDLILADVGMPGMSGDEFVATLREDSRLAKIPVIYLTALEQDHELVMKTLGYPVIAKAALAKDLLPLVKRQLPA